MAKENMTFFLYPTSVTFTMQIENDFKCHVLLQKNAEHGLVNSEPAEKKNLVSVQEVWNVLHVFIKGFTKSLETYRPPQYSFICEFINLINGSSNSRSGKLIMERAETPISFTAGRTALHSAALHTVNNRGQQSNTNTH